MELSAINELLKLFDVFKPLHTLWWLVFGETIKQGLHFIYVAVAGVPFLSAIGAYGLAIVILTVIIKLVLWPLYQLQLSLSRKSMLEQRKIAPELAAMRKKYKGDPQKQQEEMMKLYKEHGINPLGPLMGCLPALVQFPILTALYWVFLENARSGAFPAHFLFIPNLNDNPIAHPLLAGLQLPIPSLAYLIFPLLAAATTFVQSRMIQQPPNPYATEQEQQTQQMAQSMQVMMPVMILVFAVSTPAGLGLYWFVSNCVAIIQQYFVTGWGALRPANGPPPPPPPPPSSGSGGSRSARKPRRPRR